MTNIQAAIGLAQIETVDQALCDRKQVAKWYDDLLGAHQDDIALPVQHSWAKHVYWMYNVLLRDGGEDKRDKVMRQLDEMGIETRPTFYPMHVLPPYREDGAYPIANLWAPRGINLPTHRDLIETDIARICESLVLALRQS
jgi:perosamine synthetase